MPHVANDNDGYRHIAFDPNGVIYEAVPAGEIHGKNSADQNF